jgi:hypothetical protein
LVSYNYHEQRAPLIKVLGDFIMEPAVGAHDAQAYAGWLVVAQRLVDDGDVGFARKQMRIDV